LLLTELQRAQRELFPAVGVLEWTAQGVLLRSEVDSLPWFAHELARLPFAFEIRKPAALRHALRSLAERLIEVAAS
jgi:hypothetical protein